MDEPVVTTMVRTVLAREKAPRGRVARALVAENGAKPLDSKLSEIFSAARPSGSRARCDPDGEVG